MHLTLIYRLLRFMSARAPPVSCRRVRRPYHIRAHVTRIISCAPRLPLRRRDPTKDAARLDRESADANRRIRMILHDVRGNPSKDNLPREDQLAWKIAAVAADKVAVDKDVTEMIVNRIIDNAAVAIAAINRHSAV